MNFQELAKNRYSCRQMSDKKVDDKLVEQIIETAIAAPTAVDKQPFKIFWLKSDKAKEQVKEVTHFTFNADTFLVVGYKMEDGWTRTFDKRPFADVDAAIVATHILLQVEDLGLHTTWVGHFNEPLLKSFYKEMEDYILIALFPIGYAVEGSEPSPQHYMRKPKDQLVEVL